MLYLLDTCVISDFVKGDINTITAIKAHSPDELAVSAITIMEIEYGLKLNPSKAKKIRPIINSLLEQITTVNFSIKEAQIAALVRQELKAKGQPIGAYDLLIGATAIANDLTIITANTKEFERINQISWKNWRL